MARRAIAHRAENSLSLRNPCHLELYESTRKKTMALHVIVIGGGVAGLTAAHELSDRGMAVTVYERRPDWGGKARSQPVPGSAIGGRKPLPGEHGFRFYPRFYKHVIDLMQRIPVGDRRSVADYLKPTTESANEPSAPTSPSALSISPWREIQSQKARQ